MRGILRLAFKLLVNDKAKFTALLIGITFAGFGMMFSTSMFVGVLTHASSTVINVGARIWVMDPAVQTIANSIGMPEYVLDSVRSMQGVSYAVPLYSGGALVKLPDGTYQSVTVIGFTIPASSAGRTLSKERSKTSTQRTPFWPSRTPSFLNSRIRMLDRNSNSTIIAA